MYSETVIGTICLTRFDCRISVSVADKTAIMAANLFSLYPRVSVSVIQKSVTAVGMLFDFS